MRSERLLLVALFAGAMRSLCAQQNDVPLQRDIYLDLERNAACRTATEHVGLKPVLESRANLAGVMGYRPDSSRHYYWVTEKLYKEHLVDVRHDGFRLMVDPVFHFESGRDFRDPSSFADTTNFYVNSRGLAFRCDLGPRFSFSTSFYENQAIYPQYIYLEAQQTGVVPGQGRIKGFKRRAFDFAWATGNISWSPRRWLNVQFGHGRHFIGHGYRSMLLSDAAFNYPYFKVSVLSKNERWQYTHITAKLQLLERLPTGESSESLFYWKRMAVHHLSYRAGPVELGLFESMMFRTIDVDGVTPFDPLVINPVIGVNTAVKGFDGVDNALLGLDARVKLTDRLFAYGQFALDDPAAGRQGWQAGFRWFDLFGRDLHLQAEYNSATPYTYAHRPSQIGHGHYGEPLAHPVGAYFNEAVAIVDWRFRIGPKRRFAATAKVNLIDTHIDGADSLNYGGDPFKPLPDVEPEGAPTLRSTTFIDLSASWLWNQMTNLRLTVGYRMRDIAPAPDQLNSGYLYIAFRTALFNTYLDR